MVTSLLEPHETLWLLSDMHLDDISVTFKRLSVGSELI